MYKTRGKNDGFSAVFLRFFASIFTQKYRLASKSAAREAARVQCKVRGWSDNPSPAQTRELPFQGEPF